MTPEAVVMDGTGEVRYRGRINDRYVRLGVARRQATTNDLHDALRSVLDGRQVERPITQPVGCYLAPTDMLEDLP